MVTAASAAATFYIEAHAVINDSDAWPLLNPTHAHTAKGRHPWTVSGQL